MPSKMDYVSNLLGDYRPRLRHAQGEMLAIVHFGQHRTVLARRLSDQGCTDRIAFPIREIVADALNLGSVEVLLAHNHPSGIAEPSINDMAATRRLEQVFRHLHIHLLDHLIIAGDQQYSIQQLRLLDAEPAQFT
jgi:DNA repair protein RadC